MRDEHRIGAGNLPTPSPLIGARRFHQWAASQLREKVWEHYGEYFVVGAHHLLADHHFLLTVIGERFNSKPEPSGNLACPGCLCKTKDELADCLIGRFHEAFESIDSHGIVEWYSSLDGEDEIHVRAFFRAATPSDPTIREVFELILSREESPAKVKVAGAVQWARAQWSVSRTGPPTGYGPRSQSV